jgi:molybdopterin converting factor small subunit
MNSQISIFYFGHLVDLLHRDSEILFLPRTISDVRGLMAHLARRGDEWTQVFENPRESMRITVNKAFVDADAPLKGGDEIAFVAFQMA